MSLTNQNLILVVDDNFNELKILSTFLENNGFQIAIASDGLSALKLSHQICPDLILLASLMPDIDGFQTYCCLNKSPITKDIPVIFTANYNDSRNIVKAINLGAVDYLTKPFKQEEVLSRIQLHLRLHSLTLKLQQQNKFLIEDIEARHIKESNLVKITQKLEQRVEERVNQLSLALHELQKTQKELLAREAKFQHDALHDDLTGLPNRSWLMEQLQTIIKSANKNTNLQYAVLSIGLDRFKVVNDSLGHLVGDELLQKVALRLQACLSHAGKIARFGGDEFMIVLEDIKSTDDAIFLAEDIQEQLKLPFKLAGYEVFVGVSIGITLSTLMEYNSPIDVLRDAGIAMSLAKQAGKGRYEVLTPQNKTRAIARLQLENDLRQAIEREEFYLEYQPIYSLSTGQLQGFEALVRWNHPSRGRVAPAEFIPTVEEIGLIDRLGFWVLQEATRQLSKWQHEFPHHSLLVMNVNLSAKQLKQIKLLKQIDSLFSELGLPPNCLKLEITESSFLKTSSEEINMLHQLRQKGIGLCIDDFGTGYSSLSRLHNFPVNTIKVDRSFVNRLGTGSGETEIVQTIVNLAHNLGLDLVAEGIETPEQLQKLQELGYELGQGYLFSKPLNCQRARQLLSNVV